MQFLFTISAYTVVLQIIIAGWWWKESALLLPLLMPGHIFLHNKREYESSNNIASCKQIWRPGMANKDQSPTSEYSLLCQDSVQYVGVGGRKQLKSRNVKISADIRYSSLCGTSITFHLPVFKTKMSFTRAPLLNTCSTSWRRVGVVIG